MTVLLIVLVGVLGAVQFAAAATKQAATRQGAIQLANQKIENARNIPYQALGTKNADGTFGDPAGVLPADGESITTTQGAYVVSYDVWWKRKDDPDPAARTVMYKQVQVTVSWALPRAGSVSVETAIYGVDTGAVVGDVQVFAMDADTLAAVADTAVTLAPITGPSRMVETGDDGYALFGQVPYGLLTSLAASKSGYMTDPSSLTSKTVSPNVVNTWSVSLQRPKSATIHVHTSAGVAIEGASVVLVNDERGLTYGPFTTDAAGNTPAFPNLWNATGSGYRATATFGGNSGSSTFNIQTSDTAVTSTVVINTQAPITVTVHKSTDNSGLDGVQITMTGPVDPYNDGTLTTSPNGTKVFTVTRSGTYTVTAQKTGYTDQTVSFYVDLANPVNPDPIVLVPVAASVKLRVTVTDAFSGAVLSGRTVTVKDSGGVTKGSGTTDASGRIPLIDILASGQYTILVAAKTSENYQAYTGTTNISLSDPSPVGFTAGTVTGRITIQLRRANGTVPSNPQTYRVRIRTSSGVQIPSGSGYNVFDSSGNFTFAPLATDSYTYAVRPDNGRWSTSPYNYAATIVTGVSTPYVVVHVVN